jgi:FkbM family methyltransferase
MNELKRFFKRNSHNGLCRQLAGFGRSVNRFYENRNHDIYSNGEITVLKKLSTFNPSVIIDGGANTGKYSQAVSSNCEGSRIYAFEPVNNTFNELTRNVKELKNIVTIRKGLFSENCTREINLYNSNEHSSLFQLDKFNHQAPARELIELIRGDDFVRENRIGMIDFLKLDLEGAEFYAIMGFKECFLQKKIKAVQFEYGYLNIATRRLLIDFYEFFEEHGYLLGKIFPKKVEFRKYDFKYEDFIGPNFIAVNKEETAFISQLSKV